MKALLPPLFRRKGLGSWFFPFVLGLLAPFCLTCRSSEPGALTSLAAPSPGSAMPAALRAALHKARQSEAGPDYYFSSAQAWGGPGFSARNPRFGFGAQLSNAGLSLGTADGDPAARPELAVSLSHFGCAEAPKPIHNVPPRAQDNRVVFDHGSLTEWYLNGPLGLEHGFDLAHNPGCSGDLVLDLALDSRFNSGLFGERAEQAHLIVSAGSRQFVYSGLYAYDADGIELSARMEFERGRIRLRVAAAGARFPVTVDPLWSQQQKLLLSDKVTDDYFGYSVALSADGNTALIGAYAVDDATGTTEDGAAYVFTRSGSSWSPPQKLLAPDMDDSDFFGWSVALSGDGNTALIGAPSQDEATGTMTSNNGAAYVFTRSGSAWGTPQKLLAPDRADDDRFGGSVALSADGNTALIGAASEDDATGTVTTNNGAAYVFTRSGSSFAQQQKLLAPDKASGDGFGGSVALSANGNTALIGAASEDDSTNTLTNQNGAAYVFTRSGSVWGAPQKFLASDKSSGDLFGYSVALSGDGNTALIGAQLRDDSTGFSTIDNGAVYVFIRSGASFAQQQKLVPADKDHDDRFGTSVALSTDGNTALIGAYQEDDVTGTLTNQNGAAYVFVRANTAFAQQRKLVASDKSSGDQFGTSVAVSADGSTALIGAPLEDDATGTNTTNNGAAYVFLSGKPNGSPCSLGSECQSDFCTDGVCCSSACGNSDPSDCQACSSAAGAPVQGACGFLPGSQVCRPASDRCDLPAQCSGTSAACPPTPFKPSSAVCRESTDPSDPAEMCSGQSPDCPPDLTQIPVGSMASGCSCAVAPSAAEQAPAAGGWFALLLLLWAWRSLKASARSIRAQRSIHRVRCHFR